MQAGLCFVVRAMIEDGTKLIALTKKQDPLWITVSGAGDIKEATVDQGKKLPTAMYR